MTKPLISFDYAIKYLLKDKGGYDIVEAFISALLQSEGYGPIKIKALLESESNKETFGHKKSIADLVVEDESGTKYIVEIDRQYTDRYLHKACFNTSRLIVDSLSQNEDYTTIKKVFHISLLYFVPPEMKAPLYHGKTIIKEVDHQHPIDVHMIDSKGSLFDVLHIFPEYFFICVEKFNDELHRDIDAWLYVMKHEEVPENVSLPIMDKVAKRLNRLKMNVDETHAYYAYMKESYGQRDSIEAAERKGIEKGKLEGLQEGIEKGLQEGLEKSKKEIAISLLKAGMSVDFVVSITCLSFELIEELKASLSS